MIFRGEIDKPGDGGGGPEVTIDYRALDLISKFDKNKNQVCDNKTALYYTCETCQEDDLKIVDSMMSRAQEYWNYVCDEVLDCKETPGNADILYEQ